MTRRSAALAALVAAFTCALAAADEYKDAKFAKFEKTDKGNVTLEVKVKDDTKAVTVLASPTAYKVFDADGKAVKNQDLWERLDAACARHRIEWRWVKGHNGDPGNELADQLANEGCLEATSKVGGG